MMSRIFYVFFIFFILLFQQVVFADNIKKDLYSQKSIDQAKNVDHLISDVNDQNTTIKLRGTAIATELDNFFIQNANSVVYIETDKGTGSGIVLARNKILTNWHVIFGAGDGEIRVVFKPSSGSIPIPTQAHIADIIRCDSNPDLALLKPRWPPKNTQPAKLASNNTFNESLISSLAHTIGHPAGGLAWSYNSGEISQIQKNMMTTYPPPFNSIHFADTIQTQAPINPGNSGGPLFNEDGRVIGVIVSGCDTCENIGSAIAVSTVHDFLNNNVNNCKAKITPSEQPQILLSEDDRNGDGKIDIRKYDMTGSGVVNWIHLDNTEPNDDWFEVLLYDVDENGIFEIQVHRGNFQGDPIISYYDHNQDSEFDICGIDKDRDGKDDRQMTIETCSLAG